MPRKAYARTGSAGRVSGRCWGLVQRRGLPRSPRDAHWPSANAHPVHPRVIRPATRARRARLNGKRDGADAFRRRTDPDERIGVVGREQVEERRLRKPLGGRRRTDRDADERDGDHDLPTGQPTVQPGLRHDRRPGVIHAVKSSIREGFPNRKAVGRLDSGRASTYRGVLQQAALGGGPLTATAVVLTVVILRLRPGLLSAEARKWVLNLSQFQDAGYDAALRDCFWRTYAGTRVDLIVPS